MRRALKPTALAGAAILVAALAFGPQLVDKDALRITLSDQLSTALGQPVSIRHLSLKLLPHPSVTLDTAQTRFTDDPRTHLTVGRLQLSLSWRSLLQGSIMLTQLDVESVELNPLLFSHLQQLVTGLDAGQPARKPLLQLKAARLRNITWSMADGRSLGAFDADLMWQNDPRPSSIRIAQSDGRAEAQLRPDDEGIDFQVNANDWNVPLPNPFFVHRLQADGRYQDGVLQLHDANLDNFAGQLKLSGSLAWNPDRQITAKITGEHLDLPSLLSALGMTRIEGQVDGDCTLATQIADLTQSWKKPDLDCTLQHSLGDATSTIRLQTRPDKSAGLAYRLEATDLVVPAGPPLHFSKVNAHGTLYQQRLRVESARLEGYQGVLETQGELSWQKDVRITFAARTTDVQLAPLLAVFERRSLDGRLDSQCRGKLAGGKFTTLLQQPELDCDFTLVNGELYNADLEQAAKLLKSSEHTAGSTPFKSLDGRLHMSQGTSRFTQLQLQSTALEAAGTLAIDSTNQLQGELSVALKNTAGVLSVPLVVSGPTSDPLIRPTTSALAGGAAGTMILGPGLGTAIGVKLGETFQKVTGWLKPKPDSTSGEALNE